MVQGEQQEPWDGKGPQSCATAPQLQPREVACASSAIPAEEVPITLGSTACFWKLLSATSWKRQC